MTEIIEEPDVYFTRDEPTYMDELVKSHYGGDRPIEDYQPNEVVELFEEGCPGYFLTIDERIWSVHRHCWCHPSCCILADDKIFVKQLT